MARRRNARGDSYYLLNEASAYQPTLEPGKTEVWYFKPEIMRDVMMGLDWLQTQVPGVYPEPLNLSRTHIMLGRVAGADPEALFSALQGEAWSPNGEARVLIKALGLNHTSMSVGDILVVKGEALFADRVGFVKIGRVDKAE